MAKADFAVTGARPAMGRLPRAETENAMNWTSWLPLRALSGWTAKDLDGDLTAGITLTAIEVMPSVARFFSTAAERARGSGKPLRRGLSPDLKRQ
ncbi:hypothetical protein [Mesorhizobium captivum]|uniref:hypothetical protein n=1 Tax=Mesorhizobium captivum TaxID=3072319 RepID=UPI002A23BE17|nr:hypothetical protein [Mesorhizobium sp. VK23E]MDX8511421.1 hypothetical protein [Mesorhizobium sp. VK23E]